MLPTGFIGLELGLSPWSALISDDTVGSQKPNCFEGNQLAHEMRAHLPILQHSKVDDGPGEPQLEQALAHGRDTLVEHAKYAEALLGLSNSHCRWVLLLLHATSLSRSDS